MAEYLSPGVYVEEFDSGPKAMEGVSTSTAGFIGLARRGPVTGKPVLITGISQFRSVFGGYLDAAVKYRHLAYGIDQFLQTEEAAVMLCVSQVLQIQLRPWNWNRTALHCI